MLQVGREEKGLDFSELLGFPGLNAHLVRLTLDLPVKCVWRVLPRLRELVVIFIENLVPTL